MNLLDSLS